MTALLPPHHLVHHSDIALDDADHLGGNIFIHVVRHGDAVVTVPDELDGDINAMQEAYSVDAVLQTAQRVPPTSLDIKNYAARHHINGICRHTVFILKVLHKMTSGTNAGLAGINVAVYGHHCSRLQSIEHPLRVILWGVAQVKGLHKRGEVLVWADNSSNSLWSIITTLSISIHETLSLSPVPPPLYIWRVVFLTPQHQLPLLCNFLY